MTFAILGLGTAVPETVLPQEQGRQIARRLCCCTDEQASWLGSIYEHAGVHSRNIVLSRALVRDVLEGTRASGSAFLPSGRPDDRGPTTAQRLRQYADEAGPLALEAARRALVGARLAPADITHLVTVSCTGFQAPGVDVELIRRLGLPAETQRTHVGYMGCHGALNGLRVARALAGSDAAVRVLLVAVELCSLHYYYQWDPQKAVANALFGDGAAAVAGAPADFAPPGAWRLCASGSCVVPDSAGAMAWTVTDHGFAMTLSRQVPDLIAAHLRPWLGGWLGRQGLALGGVASWAVHPGGPKILDAVDEALGLPRPALEASRAVLAECGNMSSPTILFILDRLRGREAPRPCVALGFGPGLAVEAALFR
jgi:predicted naringenin-chalcone synthase